MLTQGWSSFDELDTTRRQESEQYFGRSIVLLKEESLFRFFRKTGEVNSSQIPRTSVSLAIKARLE